MDFLFTFKEIRLLDRGCIAAEYTLARTQIIE